MEYAVRIVLFVATLLVVYGGLIFGLLSLMSRGTDGVWEPFVRNRLYINRLTEKIIFVRYFYDGEACYEEYYGQEEPSSRRRMPVKLFKQQYKRISRRKADKLREADKALRALAEL